jgi:hypothetical protein
LRGRGIQNHRDGDRRHAQVQSALDLHLVLLWSLPIFRL